jgi:hypothetical protein
MKAFLGEFDVRGHPVILDVGGSPGTWPAEVRDRARIILCNMPRASGEAFAPGFLCVAADARQLPFADRSIDIVFSNSVIEHVGSFEQQARFAAEIARVGKSYWVQTPNRGFPVEVHMMMPFVHWLPMHARAWCVRHFSPWTWMRRVNADERRWYVEHFLYDIRLLSRGELQTLFPGSAIRAERLAGMTKSLVACKRSHP